MPPPKDSLAPYLLSLPERVLRSASALAGGLVREIGNITLPLSVRRSRLYLELVDSTLRFLIEQVGQVEGTYPAQGKLSEDFAVRRATGNTIEIIGILAFRASPVWVLAALADLSGAGRQMVTEIADSLKEEGLLDRDAKFENVDQLLDGLERTAGRLAETFNTPPLNVDGLREEWRVLRENTRGMRAPELPPPERVRAVWDEMKRAAEAENRSIFEISSVMTLSTLRRLGRGAQLAARRTGRRMSNALLEHYQFMLAEMRQTGYSAYWAREFSPYLKAAAQQFSPRRQSLTEKFLRRGRA
ncbi:MAG: hypothetical protein WD696_06095 [Bryobacteraceae bacterium]